MDRTHRGLVGATLMAWSQSDLTALEAAIKTGIKSVRYHDHEATYHDVKDMLALREQMRAEIADAAAPSNGSAIFAGRL